MHAHLPQAVEQLAHPGGVGIGHVDNDGLFALLRGIGGKQAAKVDQLVIGMGGQHQQIRLFRRGLPYLHPGGQIPLPQHEQLIDDELLSLVKACPQPEMRGAAKLHDGMHIGCAAGNQRNPFVVYLRFHAPFIGHDGEAHIEETGGRGVAGGTFDPGFPALAAGPTGGILAVVQARNVAAAGGADLAVSGNVLRLRGGAAYGRDQQQRRKKQQTPK